MLGSWKEEALRCWRAWLSGSAHVLFVACVLGADLESAAKALLYIMDYDKPDKEERFSSLLWSLDTFGGSSEIEETKDDMRSVFSDHGFIYANTCYLGSFSYSWQKKCNPPHGGSGSPVRLPRPVFACANSDQL